MQKIMLPAIIWLAPVVLYAQKHDYVWLGGNNSTPENKYFLINFNDEKLQIAPFYEQTNAPVNKFSIADSSGKLSFFSNGCWIKNHKNNFINNGNSLNNGGEVFQRYCLQSYHYPVYQGLFALPVGKDEYMMIHIRARTDDPLLRCYFGPLLASKIDMAANDGDGAVTFKDSLLIDACLQKAAATRHANGRDWWVLAPSAASDTFYRFLVGPTGIKGPWVQNIPNPALDTFYFEGWMSFSPNGKLFATSNYNKGTALYTFDRCNGSLSPFYFISHPGPEWLWLAGHAFSPNSHYFYLPADSAKTLLQYDLTSPDVGGSKTILMRWDGYKDQLNRPSYMGGMQQGPDGKIYIRAGDTRFMHIVHFPKRKGIGSKPKQRDLTLPANNEGLAIYYPNYRLGPLDNSPCDTLGLDNRPVALFRHDLEDTTQALRLTFTDLSYYEPAEWSWDFGDPASGAANMSRDTNPVHVFSKPGRYRVCLTVRNAHASDVFCRDIEVGSTGTEGVGEAATGVLLSPNPADGHLSIRLKEQPTEEVSLALVNALGQEVLRSTAVQQETRLDVSKLRVGLYIVRVEQGGRILAAQSVLIQH